MDFLSCRFDTFYFHELLVVLEGYKLLPLSERQSRVDQNTVVGQKKFWLLCESRVEPKLTVLNSAPCIKRPTLVLLNFMINRQFFWISDIVVACEQIFMDCFDSVHSLVDQTEADVLVVSEGDSDSQSHSEADQKVDDDVLVAKVLNLFTHFSFLIF